ncbi:MAG: AAA family ATPase [Thomasclavelia spiroformis]
MRKEGTSYKKTSIGIENFEDMIKENYYYVDKTGLLKQLLNEHGLVNLFTRPRRFENPKYEYVKIFLEIEMIRQFLKALKFQRTKNY